MNSKRVLGIVIFLVGIVMICFSMYISNQVAEGRGQISEAQGKLNQGNSLFGMSSTTKEVGKIFTSGAQSKINAYSEQADYYAQVANWLKIGGIVLVVIGVGVVVLCRKKRD